MKKAHWREWAFQVVALMAMVFTIGVLITLIVDVCMDGLLRLNWQFLTSFPSRKPEEAGLLSALFGTLWVMALTAEAGSFTS